MTKRRKTNRFAVSILLFEMAVVLFITGCHQIISGQAESMVTGIELELHHKYVAAVEAYKTEDYQGAAKGFAHVKEHAGDPLLVRKSLFGLACAAIMAADSQDEFIQAMTYWHNWIQQAPEQWDSENPLLFNPLVLEKLSILSTDTETSSGPDLDQPQVSAARQLALNSYNAITMKIELDRTKQQLEKAKGQLSENQTTIDALTKELGKLKDQLKAIELIDQKIQEKKKAIPVTE